MPAGRPAVPAALKRQLMEEAGYRCAVPTCRGTDALELAHIVEWSSVKEHSFHNMIVLCALDHYRYDQGKIPRKSIEVFKANLGLLRGRYSDAERRVLEAFAFTEPPLTTQHSLIIPGGGSYTLLYLEKDGLVEITPNLSVTLGSVPLQEHVSLTEAGIEVVERLRGALAIDEAPYLD